MPAGRNYLNELLSAVDLLTKDRFEEIFQTQNGETRRVKLKQPPLLAELRDAISSTVGAHPSGGTLPNQRSVLDSDAFEQYEKITAQIIELYNERTTAAPFDSPEQNLRIWYIAVAGQYQSGLVSDKSFHRYIKTLEGWIEMIDEKLNPAQALDILAPCPNCGELWAESKGERIQAIQIVYRLGLDSSVSSTKGTCRACKKVWDGKNGLFQLRSLLGE